MKCSRESRDNLFTYINSFFTVAILGVQIKSYGERRLLYYITGYGSKVSVVVGGGRWTDGRRDQNPVGKLLYSFNKFLSLNTIISHRISLIIELVDE